MVFRIAYVPQFPQDNDGQLLSRFVYVGVLNKVGLQDLS